MDIRRTDRQATLIIVIWQAQQCAKGIAFVGPEEHPNALMPVVSAAIDSHSARGRNTVDGWVGHFKQGWGDRMIQSALEITD